MHVSRILWNKFCFLNYYHFNQNICFIYTANIPTSYTRQLDGGVTLACSNSLIIIFLFGIGRIHFNCINLIVFILEFRRSFIAEIVLPTVFSVLKEK